MTDAVVLVTGLDVVVLELEVDDEVEEVDVVEVVEVEVV